MQSRPSQPISPALRERFQALWDAHYTDVLAYAWRRVGDEAGASDVTAETFLVAWRRLEETRDPSRAWLLAIARRVIANQRRGERRRDTLFARVATTHQPVDAEEPAPTGAVAVAFNSLSVTDREVLALVAWQELKPREAAVVLGISSARFSVRLHRARARMRKELERAGHDEVKGQTAATSAAPTPDPTRVRMETE